ncbi:MAG TPA: chorismate mutase [Thermoleophilaceae bacterium]|nr:chorismate mutase [Thermoleophilaceae bacterium]
MPTRALRGAITADRNDAESILEATEELVRELMRSNALDPADLISCIFTCTPDLNAEFPAVAARNVGLSSVPLLCAQEIAVPDSLPRVIRVMVHCELGAEAPNHVYLRDARQLRRDLEGAQ